MQVSRASAGGEGPIGHSAVRLFPPGLAVRGGVVTWPGNVEALTKTVFKPRISAQMIA